MWKPEEYEKHKIAFTFYVMEKLSLKSSSSEQKKTYPFLPPYESGIFIMDISDHHVLIFNKFCIVKNHVLIVTRRFQEQISLLNNTDLAPAFKVMRALNGFCFYNSGPFSGASQPHKHMQIMPFDKDTKYDVLKSINQIVSTLSDKIETFQLPFFKFQHKIIPLPAFDTNNYDDIGKELEKLYNLLLKELEIDNKTMSYNFILTDSWMMIVKRSKERAFDSISINSLGFMGTFLLKDLSKEGFLIKKNPLEILEEITFPLM